MASSICQLGENIAQGPSTPSKKIKRAIEMLEADDQLEVGDMVRATKLFQMDLGIATSYTSFGKVAIRTAFIKQEIEDHNQ